MSGFKPYDPYPQTLEDIALKLQGKTKEARLRWYDEHREEIRRAHENERRRAQWLDGRSRSF